MQYQNVEGSFDAAVRHLFRHLNDAAALRQNPLAKSFFAKSQTRSDNQHALAELRAAILESAAVWSRKDLELGAGHGAVRGYEIVAGICFGTPVLTTAAQLGLSQRQYYRDRRSICTRVARSLSGARTTSGIALEEPMRLLLRRASALVDQGFAEKSARLLKAALGDANSPAVKAEILLSLSGALIQYGDISGANSALVAAKRLITESRLPPRQSIVLRAGAQLTGIEFAIAVGDDVAASARLNALIKYMRFDTNGQLDDELTFRILLESCSFHFQNGRFAEARAALAEAHAVLARIRNAPPELNVYLLVQTAACAEDGSRTADETRMLYDDALRLSVSRGSARGAFYAMVGLMRAFLWLGDHDEAHKWFDRAFAVARSMEGTKPLLSACIASTYMVSTRFWRQVGQQLSHGERFARPTTLKWAIIQGAQGQLLARTGSLNEALQKFQAAVDATAKLRNQRFQSAMLREYGVTLYRLGRRTEAEAFVKEAVALARDRATDLSKAETYSAASALMPEMRASAAHRNPVLLP